MQQAIMKEDKWYTFASDLVVNLMTCTNKASLKFADLLYNFFR